VALDLPGPQAQPAKAIRADNLVGTGTPDKGLTSATFSDNVDYRETGGTPPVQRVVTSKTLETALNGGLGEIREARFAGDVRFKDGQTQATAATVRYQVASGEVSLSGNVGTAFPRVVTDQIAVDATTIEMTLDGPRMKARSVKEPVRALMQPAKPGAKGKASRTPGLMQQDKAVNGTSSMLVYDGTTSSSEFTGAAQLWQEDTLIKAETVQVNGDSGNLSAKGSVESRFRLQSTDTKTGSKETRLARGTGQTMTYEDAARKIIYTTEARLDGPQGDLAAKIIHVFLAQGSQEVERIEAFENVTLKEPDRITTGHHLNYVAASEEYEVTAAKEKMVQMLSRSDDGCQQSTGDKLTFSRSSETVRVDSHEETRSQTKTVNCSGLPPRVR
jgi:lipopolysaccharide export system protein LptA